MTDGARRGIWEAIPALVPVPSSVPLLFTLLFKEILVRFARPAFVIAVAVLLVAGCEPSKPVTNTVQPSAEDKAFAEALEAACAKAKGTPGQEAANFVTHKKSWVHNLLRSLKGEKPATEKQLRRARKVLSDLDKTVRQGPDWPRPPVCRVPRAVKPPQIDGKLDEAAWKTAVTYSGLYALGETEKRTAPATTWKILWDPEHLYFAFDCADAKIHAPKMKRDDHVYFHDCVEMFLLPDFDRGLYWEIVVSPSRSLFDALHCKYRDRWGCYGRSDQNLEGIRIGVQVRGTIDTPEDEDQGYTIELAVPRAHLPEYSRTTLAAGHELRFMLVRLDKNGDAMKVYAYQPLLSWGHNIWNHGIMKLVDK